MQRAVKELTITYSDGSKEAIQFSKPAIYRTRDNYPTGAKGRPVENLRYMEHEIFWTEPHPIEEHEKAEG